MSIRFEEAATWTPEETLEKLRSSLPQGWSGKLTQTMDWYQLSLVTETGVSLWESEHVDPKILCLDALGWLEMREHQAGHPIWRPRETEVPLHRPHMQTTVADPPDLDPNEVAAVYKTSR